MSAGELPAPIDPETAADRRPHISPDGAAAALENVADPDELARLAAMACARIRRTAGHERLRVLTQLVHTTRAVADAATRSADPDSVTDKVDAAMWKLCGAIGTELTPQPLPVLSGKPLPEEPENS